MINKLKSILYIFDCKILMLVQIYYSNIKSLTQNYFNFIDNIQYIIIKFKIILY